MTLKESVDILYDLAKSEANKNESGKYFDNDKGSFSNAHPDAYDQDKIETIISLTELIIKN